MKESPYFCPSTYVILANEAHLMKIPDQFCLKKLKCNLFMIVSVFSRAGTKPNTHKNLLPTLKMLIRLMGYAGCPNYLTSAHFIIKVACYHTTLCSLFRTKIF